VILSPAMPNHYANALTTITEKLCPKLPVEKSHMYDTPSEEIEMSQELKEMMIKFRPPTWPAIALQIFGKPSTE
jgi:hypothetical protein